MHACLNVAWLNIYIDCQVFTIIRTYIAYYYYRCGQGDCVRSYGTFNSLSYHLRDQHPIGLAGSEKNIMDYGTCEISPVLPSSHNDTHLNQSTVQLPVSISRDIKTMVASFVASLLS